MIAYDSTSSQWCNGIDPETVTIDEAKAIILNMIETHGSKLREKITFPTSPVEMASWSIKMAEALKYNETHNPADAPVLSIEASTRGVALEALISKVINNSQMLMGVEAMIAGTVGRHKDGLFALTELSEVLVYDWSTGWPLSL